MDEVRALIDRYRPQAMAVSERAYSPYSGFRVGAVLVGPEGDSFAGCNVESASYGLTQCAECTALGGAIATGMDPAQAVAMVIYLPGERALPPCGACRQVMLELMPPDAVVVSCCDSDDHRSWLMHELLPQPFLPD